MDILAVLYVIFYMFLIICLDIIKSYNDFSFFLKKKKKAHPFTTKITKTAEK